MKLRQELRAEERVDVLLPVRLWGTESEWEPFSEKVEIVDVSLKGARLKGVTAQLGLGDIIALEHNGRKAAFQVVWVGKEGSAHAGEVGIFCLEPDKLLWGTIVLPPEVAVVAPSTVQVPDAQQPPMAGSPSATRLRQDPSDDSIAFSAMSEFTPSQSQELLALAPMPSHSTHMAAPVAVAEKEPISVEAHKLPADGTDVVRKLLPVTRWINQRRTERVVIREPISVHGKTPQGRTFSETTETLVVTSMGGLLILSSVIEFGQKIRIRRKDHDLEVECRVVYIGAPKDHGKEVGVAFTSPADQFWGINFPS